jgi:hypothetical protein
MLPVALLLVASSYGYFNLDNAPIYSWQDVELEAELATELEGLVCNEYLMDIAFDLVDILGGGNAAGLFTYGMMGTANDTELMGRVAGRVDAFPVSDEGKEYQFDVMHAFVGQHYGSSAEFVAALLASEEHMAVLEAALVESEDYPAANEFGVGHSPAAPNSYALVVAARTAGEEGEAPCPDTSAGSSGSMFGRLPTTQPGTLATVSVGSSSNVLATEPTYSKLMVYTPCADGAVCASINQSYVDAWSGCCAVFGAKNAPGGGIEVGVRSVTAGYGGEAWAMATSDGTVRRRNVTGLSLGADWSSAPWVQVPGALHDIAFVGPLPVVYGRSGTNRLYRWSEADGGWVLDDGAWFTAISGGVDGTLMGVGPDGRVYERGVDGAWTAVGSGEDFTKVAVGDAAHVLALRGSSTLYALDREGSEGVTWRAVPGHLFSSVAVGAGGFDVFGVEGGVAFRLVRPDLLVAAAATGEVVPAGDGEHGDPLDPVPPYPNPEGAVQANATVATATDGFTEADRYPEAGKAALRPPISLDSSFWAPSRPPTPATMPPSPSPPTPKPAADMSSALPVEVLAGVGAGVCILFTLCGVGICFYFLKAAPVRVDETEVQMLGDEE